MCARYNTRTGLMPVALCSLFNGTFDAVQVAPVKNGFSKAVTSMCL